MHISAILVHEPCMPARVSAGPLCIPDKRCSNVVEGDIRDGGMLMLICDSLFWHSALLKR